MARFLAASAPHSGDWLLTLPVSSCGLKLSDDAGYVAVIIVLVAVSVSLNIEPCEDVILPTVACRVFATSGGGVLTD